MRRLNWSLILLGAVAPLSAFACSSSRSPPTDKELFESANEVFVGKVLSTELTQFPKKLCEDEGLDEELCQYVKVRVAVRDVLKGKTKKFKYVADLPAGPGNCSLAVFTGLYYVFYTSSKYNMVLHPGGSFFLGYDIQKRELGVIEKLKVPDRSRPEDEG